jgi:hypothetical protein
MIDLEAKISQLKFVLIGHTVQFDNQIIYFQSKSILDVFWIMMRHAYWLMNAVGILLVTSSVIFPLIKLLATVAHHFNLLGQNPVARFFVFRSGKWSMADVMVVAIFMAYIGFNGIIDSHLGNLRDKATEVTILTTNGTVLQPGYYLFLTYALVAMLVSSHIHKLLSPNGDGSRHEL